MERGAAHRSKDSQARTCPRRVRHAPPNEHACEQFARTGASHLRRGRQAILVRPAPRGVNDLYRRFVLHLMDELLPALQLGLLKGFTLPMVLLHLRLDLAGAR